MQSNSVAPRLFARVLIAVVVLGALAACGPKTASPYTFSAARDEVAMEANAIIDARLTKLGSDEPIADAVIFETRFDMEPDGMGSMDAPVKAAGSPTPGTYRFFVTPTMAGRWALKIGAKVQGESDTVRGQVIVTAR